MRIRKLGPERAVLLSSLLLSSFIVFLTPPTFGFTPPTVNHFSGCSFSSGTGCSSTIQVDHTGDVIVVTAQLETGGPGSGNTLSVTSVSDGSSDVFSRVISKEIVVGPGPNCNSMSSDCYDSEIWSTKTTLAPGIYGISVVMSGMGSIGDGTFGYLDTTGVNPQTGNTATGSGPNPVTTGHLTSSLSWTGQAIVISSLTIDGCSTATETLVPPASFSAGCVLSNFPPAGMYATAASSPNNITWSISGGSSSQYTQAAAVFTPGLFTCSITNFDGGNFVVAGNGKFYNFFCEIQSSGVSTTNAMINQVKVRFNDSNTGSCTLTCFSTASPNIVILDYSNVTKQASLDSGSSVAILGTPNVVQGFNSATGVRSMNITFPVQMTVPFSVASLNRGIELYALLNGSAGSRGFEYVQTRYFNIIDSGNGGGGGSTLKNQGACAIPSGADVFQTICSYSTPTKAWIAENTTYYQLQQYQGQFALQTADQFGNPNPFFWQSANESGSGTNPSSNSGDWRIDTGLFSWDNSSVNCCWVKTIHVTLQTVTGRVGSSNLWTKFAAAWFDGSTLVKNDTFYAFVPSDAAGAAGSQVNIWLNFWYSQNNGSTTIGGEVGAYYTGMHKAGFLIWTSWSPFLGNHTQSQVFMTLKDHSGNIMNAQQAQMTKVYMNMTRPGAPGIHSNQANFQIETLNFQEQEFNTASQGMTGIVTPTFAVAVVPTIQSNSIFSPIINAIKSIATYFIKAIQAVGTAIWHGIGAQFPWFTGFWSTIYAYTVDIYNLATTAFSNLIGLLGFIFTLVKNILTPIQIIANSWGQLLKLFSWIPANQLPSWIELFIIIVFGLDLIDALANNDWPHIFHLVSTTFRVMEWVLQWMWRAAKIIIDSLEGLIP